MYLVITALSLAVALLAVVSLNAALISTVIDEGGGVPWSQFQFADALAMILLGLLGATLVWIEPIAAEAVLWTAALAGMLGVFIDSGLMLAANNEHLSVSLAAVSALVSGAAPAVVAAGAALLTHFVLLPGLLEIAY